MPQQSTRDSTKGSYLTRSIARIREVYEIGLASLKKYPPRMGYGHSMEEAQNAGVNAETLRQARRFADGRQGGYTYADLDSLIACMEKHGNPIGIRHLCRLLTVKKKSTRTRLQEQVISEGWSCHDLDAELRRRFGSRRPSVGRKPRLPTVPGGTRYELLRRTQSWRKLVDFIQTVIEKGQGSKANMLSTKEWKGAKHIRATMFVLERLLEKQSRRHQKG